MVVVGLHRSGHRVGAAERWGDQFASGVGEEAGRVVGRVLGRWPGRGRIRGDEVVNRRVARVGLSAGGVGVLEPKRVCDRARADDRILVVVVPSAVIVRAARIGHVRENNPNPGTLAWVPPFGAGAHTWVLQFGGGLLVGHCVSCQVRCRPVTGGDCHSQIFSNIERIRF